MLVVKLFGVSPVFCSGVLCLVAHPSLSLFSFSLIDASLLTTGPSPVSDQGFGAMIIGQVPFPLSLFLLLRPSFAVHFSLGAQLVDMLAVILALLLFSFLGAIHVATIVPGERLCIHPLDQSEVSCDVSCGDCQSIALTSLSFVVAFLLLFSEQWFDIPHWS